MIQFVSVLLHDVFFVSCCVYLVSVFLESLRRGIMVSVINLNLVLLICLISGFLTAVLPETYPYKKKSVWYNFFFLLTGGAVGFFIDQSTQAATSYHIFFGLSGGILVSLLGFTILCSSKNSPTESS